MINNIKRFHKITKYTNYMVTVINCVLILSISTEIAIFCGIVFPKSKVYIRQHFVVI